MVPVLVGLLSAASAAEPLPWYRQAEVGIGLGSAANSHADSLVGMARLSAGWRWDRRFGIELVTGSPDLVAMTPGLTWRPVQGRVVPVFSAGLGLGVANAPEGCGGPFDGQKGCGWSSRGPWFEEAHVQGVGRGSLGLRMDVEPGWVLPAVDGQVQTGGGWEVGMTVSVGLDSEKTTAPGWVVETRERIDAQRVDQMLLQLSSGDRDVEIAGWHLVMDEYRRLPAGERRDAHEAVVLEALATGRFSRREAADVYRFHGTELEPLRPALMARRMDCASGARALRVIAERTGQREAAAALLSQVAESASCDVHAEWARLSR